jgi:hypothetical protein
VGESQFRRRDIQCGPLNMYVLCGRYLPSYLQDICLYMIKLNDRCEYLVQVSMNNTMKRLTSIYVIRNPGKRKVEVLLEPAGQCRFTGTGEALKELVGQLVLEPTDVHVVMLELVGVVVQELVGEIVEKLVGKKLVGELVLELAGVLLCKSWSRCNCAGGVGR